MTHPFDWDTYVNDPMEFYAVVTDIESGLPIYKKCERLDKEELLWLRASASMPLVSRIIEIEGKKLLDGGLTDSIPIRFFESLGYDKNLLILTQPADYVKSPTSLMGLIKLKYKKYPRLIEAMERRHEDYNEVLRYINEKEKAGEIIVLRPPAPLDISKTEHDPKKINDTYLLGRRTAEDAMEKIKNFFN